MDNCAFECKPIYIVGPTGSGKSALAMKLAEIFDAVIISADSMQIYKTLDIGTAKESVDNRRKIQHEIRRDVFVIRQGVDRNYRLGFIKVFDTDNFRGTVSGVIFAVNIYIFVVGNRYTIAFKPLLLIIAV